MPANVSQDHASTSQDPIHSNLPETLQSDVPRRVEPATVPSEPSQHARRRESNSAQTIQSECETYDGQSTSVLDAIVVQCRTGSISKAIATRKILDHLDEQHTVSPRAREQAFASFLAEINSITTNYEANPLK